MYSISSVKNSVNLIFPAFSENVESTSSVLKSWLDLGIIDQYFAPPVW